MSPVGAHRVWVVSTPSEEPVDAGVQDSLNFGACGEIAPPGEGVATPDPTTTEAAAESVNDGQESALAQLTTAVPDGVREAPPVRGALIEEVPGTGVDLSPEPENDPVLPVASGRTEEPYVRLWVNEFNVDREEQHGVRVFTRSEEHLNNLRARIQSGVDSQCGGEFHFRTREGMGGHAVACMWVQVLRYS